MKPKLKVGSAVNCQYFNIPDNKFYGNVWFGKVLKIEEHRFSNAVAEIGYLIEHVGTELPASWMRRKEIRNVLWETESTVFSVEAKNCPFSLREEVMMWDVYLEGIRPEKFIISEITKKEKGCQSGWMVGVVSRETTKKFVNWDSDWFISMDKFEKIKKEWTQEDTANYQAEERAADAHLDDSDMNEEVE